MKGYVYILKDAKGRFYVGSTVDIQKRVKQHAHGHTQTTRNMQKPNLVLVQEYGSLELARKIERRIKGLKRKDFIEKMVVEGYIKLALPP